MTKLQLAALAIVALFATTSAGYAAEQSLSVRTLATSPANAETSRSIGTLSHDSSLPVSVAWRLEERNARDVSYDADNDVFIYETDAGRRAVKPSGERDQAPAGKKIAGAISEDAAGNKYEFDDPMVMRASAPDGSLRYKLEWTEPTMCAAAPSGDVACASPAFGVLGIRLASASPRLVVDGRERSLSHQPLVTAGTTFVPIRATFQALSAPVEWDTKSHTVHASKGSKSITLKIGETTALVNGKTIALSKPSFAKDGVTYVPLRFVSEALGYLVVWERATQSIQIASR